MKGLDRYRFVFRGILVILACTVIADSGCSRKARRAKVVSAHGRIVMSGRPVDKALIFFVPVSQAKNPNAVRPRAVSDFDGRFVLGTYQEDDGAPPGEYIVTIHWPKLPAGQREMFDSIYGDVSQSPLRVQINPNSSEALEIDVQ